MNKMEAFQIPKILRNLKFHSCPLYTRRLSRDDPDSKSSRVGPQRRLSRVG